MRGDPVLATKDYAENGRRERIVVTGGVHYIKGNSAPYFSLTCEYGTASEFARGDTSGGAAHEEIAKHFGDRFTDLAALHLSDIDGVPMYALENGFFRFYDDGGSYGTRPTWAKRQAMIAEHFRISESDVETVLLPLMGEHYSIHAGVFTNVEQKQYWGVGCPAAKARLADWIETQRPRWKAEADACIAKHSLKVYGDAWTR